MSERTGRIVAVAWGVISLVVFGLVAHDMTLPEAERLAREQTRAEARTERRREAERRRNSTPQAERAVRQSVLAGEVVWVEGYTGTMDVHANEAFTVAWEKASCDYQRANMLELFRGWRRSYGNEAHTVILRSWTGREIGRISQSAWSGGMRYHCG